MKLALCAAMSLAAACGLAHAELTIWQVENNPPGADSGSEWLTIINTGEYGVFAGYDIRTTHGYTIHHAVPALALDACEYHKITFERQSLDNVNDTILLLRHDLAVYETPVIMDTVNDDRFWVNPDVAAACDDPREGTVAGNGPLTESAKDTLIRDLDRENHMLKVAVEYLQAVLSDALNMINGLLGTGR